MCCSLVAAVATLVVNVNNFIIKIELKYKMSTSSKTNLVKIKSLISTTLNALSTVL